MKSQVLRTVWGNISGEAPGKISDKMVTWNFPVSLVIQGSTKIKS